MYDILDISRYVLYYAKKCGHGLSVLQLMKILYFVQAQFLISRKKRAFSDEIVAMDWGLWREKSGRITNPAEMAIFQYFLESILQKKKKNIQKQRKKFILRILS